ncbi:pmp10, partial [Symbiodinium necroappetens]
SSVSSFDCWGLADGPVNLFYSIALSWAIPVLLLLLSWSWLGLRSWRLCLVVWGNVFIPPLMGAAATLVPCFSTHEGGRRFLMYEAAFETPCASKLTESMVLPRFWLAVGTTVLLAVIGPVLWLSLAMSISSMRRGVEDDRTVGFLVAGYEPGCRWWEVTVLVRKSAIYVVAACFPMSWAPEAHLVYLLLITVVAELVHCSIRPYVSPRLNRLEGQVLGVSCTNLVLVISLLSEWPYRPYSIYVGTCVLLFLLTAGTYLFFLCFYIRAVFTRDDSQKGRR